MHYSVQWFSKPETLHAITPTTKNFYGSPTTYSGIRAALPLFVSWLDASTVVDFRGECYPLVIYDNYKAVHM